MTSPVQVIKQFAKMVAGPRYMLNRQVSKQLIEGEAELHFLPILCRKDGEFLDVGANVGYYAAYAAKFSGRVVAMEPHPQVADQLTRSAPRNVQVIRAAASDREGKAELRIPIRAGSDVATRSSIQSDANPGFQERIIEVDIVTVDSVDLKRLMAMKIDVEGHELAVLRGATKTIEKFKPAVIVECEERHNAGATSRLFNFFSGAGYDGFFYLSGRLESTAAFDRERLQNPEESKPVLGRKPEQYINNFVFLPRASAQARAALEKIALTLPGRGAVVR
jgi:FkbM family methyltransferase